MEDLLYFFKVILVSSVLVFIFYDIPYFLLKYKEKKDNIKKGDKK